MKVRLPSFWCRSTILLIIGACGFHLLQPVNGQTQPRTSAALSAGLNLSGLDELLATVREDLLPELIIAMNEFVDNNLSFSRSESVLGVTVSVSAGISQFVLQTADNSIGLQVEDTATSTTAARVKLNASNVRLGATATASVSVSAPGLGGVSCFLGVDGLANVRSLDLALGVAKVTSVGNNDITIRAADANVPSFLIALTPKTSTNNVCNAVNQLIASAFGVVANTISTLTLNLFNGQLVNGLAAILDGAVVPIAQFSPSVSIGSTGVIRPTIGLEKISAISNTFLVDVGGALNVELRQPAFRAGRSLTASSSATPKTMPQVIVDDLVGMNINLGTFNRLVETMWYLGRSALGGVDDERLTQESSLCAEQATPSDPCPFPPFSFSPGIFGEILLWFLFFGNRNFRVEAILLPPAVDAFGNSDLQGSVASRVAVTGTGLFGGGGGSRKVLATAGVDVVLSTGLPQYDGATGLVRNVKIASIEAVDFAFDFDGVFPLFWFFTSIAESFVTNFALTAANSFIDAANDEIGAFLQRTPLFTIPTLRKFPTARTDVQLSLSNVALAGVPAGTDTDGFLSLGGGLALAVRPRADAPPRLADAKGLVPSLADVAPTVYREAYDECATVASAANDPNLVVTRSYSSVDGTVSVLYTCRWVNGKVEMFDPDNSGGTWSEAFPPP